MPLTARRPSQEIVDIVGALGGTWSGNVAMCRCPALWIGVEKGPR